MHPTDAPQLDSAQRGGIALVAVAATGFGAMAVLAKYGYDAGLNVVTLVLLRFGLAAPLLWLLALRIDGRPGARALLNGLGLGFALYSVQAGLFLGAVGRMDASLAALLLYIYPGIVMVGAIALGRERPDRRRVGALLAVLGGVALVLVGGGQGLAGIDAIGAVMALAAAATYSAYILASEHIARGAAPLTLAAAVTTGGGLAFAIGGGASGTLDFGFDASAWLFVGAVALVSTVIPIAAFLAGVVRIGSSSTAIVCGIEPTVTVLLAMACFGESLAAPQILGGAVVLAAVAALGRIQPPPELVARAWPPSRSPGT